MKEMYGSSLVAYSGTFMLKVNHTTVANSNLRAQEILINWSCLFLTNFRMRLVENCHREDCWSTLVLTRKTTWNLVVDRFKHSFSFGWKIVWASFDCQYTKKWKWCSSAFNTGGDRGGGSEDIFEYILFPLVLASIVQVGDTNSQDYKRLDKWQ